MFYLGDANYNVTALVNMSGQVVERYAYDPYGTVTVYTPDWLGRTVANHLPIIRFSIPAGNWTPRRDFTTTMRGITTRQLANSPRVIRCHIWRG